MIFLTLQLLLTSGVTFTSKTIGSFPSGRIFDYLATAAPLESNQMPLLLVNQLADLPKLIICTLATKILAIFCLLISLDVTSYGPLKLRHWVGRPVEWERRW